MENTRDLAPGLLIWIFFRTRTTASTFVEWLPYRVKRLQCFIAVGKIVFYLHCLKKKNLKSQNIAGIASDLHRDILPLVGTLSGEHIWNLWMWSGLSAYGALYGSPSIANAVLLYNDGDAPVTETVSTGQYSPLSIKNTCSEYIHTNIHLTNSFLFLFYLLTQRSSTDWAWFWIQTASGLILRLNQSIHELLHHQITSIIYKVLQVHQVLKRIYVCKTGFFLLF